MTFKIRGPSAEQIRKMAERGKHVLPCRRSWIGFFRIVDDIHQIRALDRWLRAQISMFMMHKHRRRVNLSMMKSCGLPSLVNSLWRARARSTRYLAPDEEAGRQTRRSPR